MSLGSRILCQRKVLNMTQNQLAEMLGVSFQAVSSWERDAYLPETEKLNAIATALGVTVAFVLDDDRAPLPHWHTRDRLFSEERMYTFVKAAAATKDLHGTLKRLLV